MSNKILLLHQRTLAHHLAKYPDQLDRVNAVLDVANLGYITGPLRNALIAFVNHTLKLSYSIDGIKPVLFGDIPKQSKDRVIYKDRIIYRDKVVTKEIVVKEKPTLPPRIPVLTDVVEIPSKEGREMPSPWRSLPASTKPKSPVTRKPAETLEERRARCSRQMKRSSWWHLDNKAVRLPEGIKPPPGFKPGMLKRKGQELTNAK
jgi:hypothetical protein